MMNNKTLHEAFKDIEKSFRESSATVKEYMKVVIDYSDGFFGTFKDDETLEEVKTTFKRLERCTTCPNMTKKELKRYDSCPDCGKSLFAQKQRKW